VSNPYQAPKAPVEHLAGQPKGALPLAGAVVVASAAAIALVWLAPILSALITGLIAPGQSPVYLAIELSLVFVFVCLCGLLAIRLAGSSPYLAALPVGLVCSLFSLWEAARSLRVGEFSLWYYLVSVLVPLAAAAAAAIFRGRRGSPR
jgi:hypothetical protein